MNVKTVVLAGMAVFAISSTLPTDAHAKCGPDLSFNLNQSTSDRNDGHSITAQEFNDTRSYYVYGPSKDNTDDLRVGFTIRWSLGEDHCEEQEAARLHDAKERAQQAKLRNIEKQIQLCTKYGVDHPLLKGQCK